MKFSRWNVALRGTTFAFAAPRCALPPFFTAARWLTLPGALTLIGTLAGALPASADAPLALPPAAMLPPVTSQTTKRTLEVPLLDPNKTSYPRSSLYDFSDLQDAPAGKYGFLQVRGDHFVWPNGQRARFWGINVANTSLQEPEAEIDAIILNFKTAGFNLVRLHHFDERGGIIDLTANDSRHLLAERLAKLDYWIYKARRAGMYVYLDLLDYRRFKDGDGVENAEAIGRAGRPYAVFDARLMELQKEYALKLMREHVNPYTGLAYADDPAIVMLEIYDESGLFMRRGVWREMPEPYAARFKKLWNDWLRAHYRTTADLNAAWTDGLGVPALTPGESLEAGTVEVPAMTWTPQHLSAEEQRFATLPRRNDGARFAYELHKKFFREMRGYLRSIGVKIPLSATGRFEDLADAKSISEELDYVGTNFYYDHPYWGTGAPAWQPPSFFHNHNPLSDIDDRSMAAAISLARVKGKPLVVREWNYCWPNHSRAGGMVEAACYAALHDIDAMILFVYETRPTARVSYFNVRSDPSRWGLCGVGAQIFLKGLIQPSRHRIVIPYGPVDTFTYTQYHQPFYALGWATRVENDYFDGNLYWVGPDSKTDLILNPGRSAMGRYEGAPAVLHTENMRRDLAGRTATTPEYLAGYDLTPAMVGQRNLVYDGLLFDRGDQQVRMLTLGLPLAPIVGAGLRPIGAERDGSVANGFVDKGRQRFVFGSLEPFDVLRAALDAMQEFHGVTNRHDATDDSVFYTDTGEMMRDAPNGRLLVSAPQFQALCGNWAGLSGKESGLNVRNFKYGTIVALSLDGKPLVESRRFMIKLVTDARNADEVSGRDPRFVNTKFNQWRIDVLGAGPVTTNGREAALPLEVGLGRRPVLSINMERGSFELLVDGDDWKFYCDTPGIRFTLHHPQPVRPATLAGARSKPGVGLDASGVTSATELQAVTWDGDVRPLAGARTGGTTTSSYPQQTALVRAVG